MTYFDAADNSCPEKGPSAGANWGQLGVIEHVYVGIHSLQIPIAENCSGDKWPILNPRMAYFGQYP
jgi:hypothetical protein